MEAEALTHHASRTELDNTTTTTTNNNSDENLSQSSNTASDQNIESPLFSAFMPPPLPRGWFWRLWNWVYVLWWGWFVRFARFCHICSWCRSENQCCRLIMSKLNQKRGKLTQEILAMIANECHNNSNDNTDENENTTNKKANDTCINTQRIGTQIAEFICQKEGKQLWLTSPNHQKARMLLSHSLQRYCEVQCLKLRTASRCKTKFDLSNPEHAEDLAKLWKKLSPAIPETATPKENQNPPPNSNNDLLDLNWELVGFQTNNPTTDFRGVGVFGLECLLHFCDVCPEQALSMLRSSRDSVSYYPFCVVGITFAGDIRDWLREGNLDIIFTTTQITENSLGVLFVQLMLSFKEVWKTGKHTLSDFLQVHDILARRWLLHFKSI